MEIRQIHPWHVSPQKAVEIQKRLRSLLVLERLSGPIRSVAGTDVSCSRNSDLIWAGVVVFSYPDLYKIEERWIKDKTSFPYIPGLLSFREIPAIIKSIKKLKTVPDLILCDGQGIAHPRGLGLASHLGLLLDKPTVGCAKSRLVGEFSKVGENKGDHSRLLHKGRAIGSVLRTRTGVRPLFTSPGNRISQEESLKVVLDCCLKYRIPEPIRQAHLLVNGLRQNEEKTPKTVSPL